MAQRGKGVAVLGPIGQKLGDCLGIRRAVPCRNGPAAPGGAGHHGGADPHSREGRALALAQCFEAVGDWPQAEKKYRQALDAAPQDAATVRQVAEFLLRNGQSQQAEEQLRRFTSGALPASEADRVWARRVLALTLAGRGDYRHLKEGLDLLEKNLAQSNPAIQDRRAKAVLLASHPLRQRRREAAEILEKVLVQPAPSAEDRFLAAKLYIGQGDWVNASRHFRSLLTQDRKTAPYAQYLSTYISALLARQETPEAELWLPGLEAIAPEQWTTTMLRASALPARRVRRGHCPAQGTMWGRLPTCRKNGPSRCERRRRRRRGNRASR